MFDPEYKPVTLEKEGHAIDAEIASRTLCPRCGTRCHYEGYEHQGSYIALAVCPKCRWEREF